MESLTSSAHFRFRLKQYGMPCLCGCAGFLVLLSIMVGVVYRAFQEITLQSLAQLNSEFSVQTDTLSSLVQTTVRSYGLQVFYTPAVTRLRQGYGLSNVERVYGLRELNTYVSSSEFVDSISVYNQNTHMVYTTDTNFLSAPIDGYADRSAAELFLNRNVETRMRPIRRTVDEPLSGRKREFYSFLFFETSRKGIPRGNALMINLRSEWYEGQLLGFDQEGSYILLDERGGLIAAREETLPSKAALFWNDIVAGRSQEEQDSYLLRKIGGVQTVCLYSRMSSTGWYCLRILPLDRCLAGLPGLRNRFVAGFSFGLTLLALLCGLMLFFIYFPFRRMRLALRRIGPAAPEALPPDQRLTELVESSLELRQSHLLDNLLEGKETAGEQLPAFPAVLLLAESISQNGLRRFLQAEFPEALVTHQNGYGVALLPGIAEMEALSLCGGLAAQFGCRCYYSMPRPSPSELPGCFSVLKELQQLRFWYPGQRILSEKRLEKRSSESGFSEKDLSQLLAALRAGELERARSCWKAVLDSISGGHYQDQRFVFNRAAQLLREMLAEAGLPFRAQEVPLAEHLEKLEDIGTLNARYDAVFVSLAALNAGKRRQRLDSIAAQVAHRIEVGYEDSGLSASKIADEMGLSNAYLSRMFRESYQMSISEYLNHTRVERACALLENGALNVEAVAAKVGFENTKYFYVVFKNLTGQTPLQYRKAKG